jgi:type VI secretion system protein ImpH
MLASAERGKDGRLHVLGYFLGLFGPQGPLPLHLTEYAHDRVTNARDRTFTAFADIFHHRVLELFYRAWADVRPTVHFDRPDQDGFATYIGALIGIATPELVQRDLWPDRAKLHFAGILSGGTKNRSGLEALLCEYLGLPARVEECMGQWLTISPPEQTRLGVDRSSTTLGRTAVLGETVWNIQHKLRVVVGPISVGQLMQYLPGSPSLARLSALLMNYLGYEYSWDVKFLVKRERLPGMRLGSFGHLGWTSWVSPQAAGAAVDDVVLNVPEPQN